jgi:S-adenosylmethionine-diacylglycerol 3-amino-3-carboxypropyl transferase
VLELKVAALRALDHPDLLRFLGVTPGRDRLRTYRALRGQLPAEAAAYWDANPRLLRMGVVHGGRFENYFRLFRRWVLPLTQSRRTVRAFLRCQSIEEQRALYQRAWNNRRWRMLFRVFFSQTLLGRLGRDPAFFEFVDVGDIGEFFLGRTAHVFADVPIADNFFIEYILTGRHSQRHGLPPYLEAANQAPLRDRLGRLRIVRDSMERYLADPATPTFDGYNLSDCFEWMSESASEQLLRALLRTARPGARLCYWNLLVNRQRPAALARQLVPDEKLAAELHATDRAFFYRRFVVERVAVDQAPAAAAGGA